jgi:hypothetical protein
MAPSCFSGRKRSYEVSLEHLTVPKRRKANQKAKIMQLCQKDT